MARRKQNSIIRPLFLVGGVALLGLLLWWFDAASEDRHWNEFSEAGERALERGNLAYAERMLSESLQYAQGQKDEAKMIASYRLLHRLYKAKGEEARAQQMLERARAVGRED
ncbi:MAG: hypothetical protein HOC74_04155 [Gemmatimonadetes bacterium]|jgi:hypothetical protein|nr:hypothetical protein [Gemmatimonadota bacterium]